MAEEIINRLGFDCSQALQALDQLDQKMRQVGQTMTQFGQTMQGASTAGRALDTIGRHLDGTTQATQRLTVSWGYLTSRILYTQMVVSYFGKFRRMMEDAASSAVDYQKKIAEITTISDLSFGGASGTVRALSDQYNVPLLEEAAGLYQTLSNGITDAAEATQFLAEANKFAKATNSTTANSVDLLSGAIKGFGLSTEDTGKAAGVLFEAIRAGRITASELGSSFGRVGPRAAELGLSLEETAAALAAITVRGVKTSEAITQLGGILTALTKPTEEMAAALHKMGFSSGEAAIATLKLPGLLQALADSTNGTSAALATMFPNVRGIAGQLALTGEGLKEFAANVTAMETAGANQAASKYLQATATDAEKVTKEINKLKTALTVDLGQSVLKAAADLSQFVGGADSVIQIAKAGGPALIGLGAGFVTLRASMAAAKLEAMGLAKALGMVALVPVAIGAGTSLGQYIGSEMTEQAFANLRTLEDANAKSLEDFKRQQSEKRDAANKADDARVQAALRVVQQLNQSYLSDLDNFKRSNDALVKNAEAGLNKVLQARERLVAEFNRAIAESESAVKSSQDRASDLSAKSEDREFTRRISPMDDARQAFALSQRAQDLASRAARDLATATSQEQIDRALALFGRAERYGEQAAQIAERTENRSLEARAAAALNGITQKQIEAERQLQALQKARIPGLEAERDRQQAVVDMMREQIKVALDSSKMFDRQGQPLSADELAKQTAARQAALQKIANAALSQKDLTAMGALGIADFVQRFQSELSQRPVQLAFAVEQGIAKAQADIQKSFTNFRAQFDVAPLQAALGKSLQSPDEAARALVETKAKAADLRAEFDKAMASREKAQQQLAATAEAVSASLDRITERLQGVGDPAALKAVNAFRAALADPGLTTDRLQSLVGAVDPLIQKLNLLNWGGIFNAQNVNDFSAALDALIKRADALKTLQTPLPDTTQLQQLEGVINRLQGVPAELGGIGPAINAGVGPSAAIADNMQRAAQAAAQAAASMSGAAQAAASMSGASVNQAVGGMIYRASGGAVGTDTIPAMLSPGEFVMSASATRRFASQLIAMNAGITPVFHDGGSVTNNTVGDIHIHAASQPEATGREVVRQIQRELRRKTSRL